MFAGAVVSSAEGPDPGSPSKSEVEAATYKAAAVATVKEYLGASDMGEVANSLQDLQQPHLAHIFVKQVKPPLGLLPHCQRFCPLFLLGACLACVWMASHSLRAIEVT